LNLATCPTCGAPGRTTVSGQGSGLRVSNSGLAASPHSVSAAKQIRYSRKRGVWQQSPNPGILSAAATPLVANVNPFSPDVREKRRRTSVRGSPVPPQPPVFNSALNESNSVPTASFAPANLQQRMNEAARQPISELLPPPRSLLQTLNNAHPPAATDQQAQQDLLRTMKRANDAALIAADGAPANWWLSRYANDFEELEEIGFGSFGKVYRCRKRLDGWEYAVKSSRRKIRGEYDMQNVLREVYALAALGDNRHVVRYYSAWIEENILYIQTEYLAGGSILEGWKSGSLKFDENEVRELLFQVASGLNHFHSHGLVHLDIKPENLFLSADGCYKIGDLGLTTFSEVSDITERTFCSGDLSEGDSRYLCKDILEENYSALSKADILALGLSAYELARGPQYPLPTMGEEWQKLRSGGLEPLDSLSPELNDLLRQMVDPDANKRPSAAALSQNNVLLSRKRTRALDSDAQAEIDLVQSRLDKLKRAVQSHGLDPEALMRE